MRLLFLASQMQQTATTGIDWNEIIYVVVGAVIGFIASIIVMVMERVLDKKGKLNIFYKRINQKIGNGLGWGFDRNIDGRLFFHFLCFLNYKTPQIPRALFATLALFCIPEHSSLEICIKWEQFA